MRNVNCQASHFIISIMLLNLVRREGEERERREREYGTSEGLRGEDKEGVRERKERG